MRISSVPELVRMAARHGSDSSLSSMPESLLSEEGSVELVLNCRRLRKHPSYVEDGVDLQ
jgi:hypothetical protein